jgi:hypothetical protein
MNSKRILFFTVGLLTIGGLLFFISNSRSPRINDNAEKSNSEIFDSTVSPNNESAAQHNQTGPNASNLDPEALFLNQIQSLSQQVGQTHNDPQQIEKMLDSYAAQLNADQLKTLQQKAISLESEADLRALSVDLLARNGSDLAIRSLANLALSEIPQLEPNSIPIKRRTEFETVLRAMAIEGLQKAKNPDLAKLTVRQIIHKSSNQFLIDRAHRARASLEQGLPSPEKQDEEALKKLTN